MNHYAAIDVSLELSSVCIVDATGKVVKETKVETHPEALVKFFKSFGLPLARIGLEAGPLSQWLYAGLTEAGFETTPCGQKIGTAEEPVVGMTSQAYRRV